MRDVLDGDAEHFDIRNPVFNDPDIIYDVYSAMRNRGSVIHTTGRTSVVDILSHG